MTSAPNIGTVTSADIAVPDHDAEVRFHASVLGTGAAPLWRDDLMNSRGEPIIGLGPTSPDYAQLPLQWMPHIQVADVAASAAAALRLGGDELMHGKDESGASQWAVLRDPGGAAFGLIPLFDAPPADAASPTGRIARIELDTADDRSTREFYREVVGWTVRDADMLDASGTPIACIRSPRDEDRDVPAVWLLHLPVGDLAESLRRVRDGGGRVLREPAGELAAAVIEDPVGACLALVQGASPADV